MRDGQSITLLSSGQVLSVGGSNGTTASNSSQLYEPATGVWTSTANLSVARYDHTATALSNGHVLVVGGYNGTSYLGTAELYDPMTGTWSSTGSLTTVRGHHTATLLASGKVLIVGGLSSSGTTNTAEIYDPAVGTWATTANLGTDRQSHTATVLPSGQVLVVGGYSSSAAYLRSAEIYDSAAGTWSAAANLVTERYYHTATLLLSGKVLVTGGWGTPSGYLSVSELYDPSANTWVSTGSLPTTRYMHSATLLPNGKVLVAGGASNSGSITGSALYDPSAGTWAATGSLATARYNHRAIVLPSGLVMISGGTNTATGALSSVETYDSSSGGTWASTTNTLPATREFHTATLLPSGRVLVVGGLNGSYLATAALYDASTGNWSATGSLTTGRDYHTATLLMDGTVLVAGGYNGANLATCQIYTPSSGTWSSTGSLATARRVHTATLLPTGEVLVAGGYGSAALSSVEIYHPSTSAWTTVSSLAAARYFHTATLLQDGRVLVAGGFNGTSYLSTVQIYSPTANTWASTANLPAVRGYHTATLLPLGTVLVTGGYSGSSIGTSVLFDPAGNSGLGTWVSTGSLATSRYDHTATVLQTGDVLVAGGYNTTSGALATAQIYDTAAGTWASTGSLATARYNPTATLLANGKVLVAGGYNGTSYFSTAQTFDLNLGFSSSTQPAISSSSATINGTGLALSGAKFTGYTSGTGNGGSDASGGGGGGSATNFPVVQLRSIGNGDTMFLSPDPSLGWSSTSFTSAPVNGFTPGYALATMFINGVPGISVFTSVVNSAPILAASTIAGLTLTPTTATLTGNVTASGGQVVTARGIVYSLTSASSNPHIGGTGVTNVPATANVGSFSTTLTGLTPNKSYSFEAYATNSLGTTYTSAWSFTTPCPTIAVINPGIPTGYTARALSCTFTSNISGAAAFSTSSTLPSGMTLSSAGVLSGTPAATGTFSITVTATDVYGCTGTNSTAYALEIAYPILDNPQADPSNIVLTWSGVDPGATCRVQRALALAGTYSDVATVSATAANYIDAPPTTDTYTYRIRAELPSNTGAWSNESPPVQLVTPSFSMSGAQVTPTTVSLLWGPALLVSSYTSWEVQVTEDNGTNWTVLTSSQAGNINTYIHTPDSSAETYKYRVRASRAGFYGAWSSELTVTRSTPPTAGGTVNANYGIYPLGAYDDVHYSYNGSGNNSVLVTSGNVFEFNNIGQYVFSGRKSTYGHLNSLSGVIITVNMNSLRPAIIGTRQHGTDNHGVGDIAPSIVYSILGWPSNSVAITSPGDSYGTTTLMPAYYDLAYSTGVQPSLNGWTGPNETVNNAAQPPSGTPITISATSPTNIHIAGPSGVSAAVTWYDTRYSSTPSTGTINLPANITVTASYDGSISYAVEVTLNNIDYTTNLVGSASATITPPSPPLPAPFGLSASYTSGGGTGLPGTIVITWSYYSGFPQSGFVIYRKGGYYSPNWTAWGTVGSDVTTFSDAWSLDSDTSYQYKVVPVFNGTESPNSASTSITTPSFD